MKQENLRQIHQVQLQIMDSIHKVCVEYGLKYYMIGGTALGALRHKGFIPWDIDIDIAMPRGDYEKFITIYSKYLGCKFRCYDYRTTKEHFSPHAIVAMNNSKVMLSISHLNSQLVWGGYGLYVDILPLDKVPNNKKLRKLHKLCLKFIDRILIRKRGIIGEGDTKLKIALKGLISKIMPMSLYTLNKYQQKIAQMYNYLPNNGEPYDICSTLSHYRYEKLCMPIDVWGEPQLYEFEDRMYYGPEKIEEYLQLLFGDFMKLPSLEEREQYMNNLVRVEWTDEKGIHVYE